MNERRKITVRVEGAQGSGHTIVARAIRDTLAAHGFETEFSEPFVDMTPKRQSALVEAIAPHRAIIIEYHARAEK